MKVREMMMLVPKRKFFRSKKHKLVVENRKTIASLQLMCYKGGFPMQCNCNCPLSKSCWFYGLKPVKE